MALDTDSIDSTKPGSPKRPTSASGKPMTEVNDKNQLVTASVPNDSQSPSPLEPHSSSHDAPIDPVPSGAFSTSPRKQTSIVLSSPNRDPATPQAATVGLSEAPTVEATGVRDDVDSAIDDNFADSTASLTSTAYEYRRIHGRPFHSEFGNASYWGTVDEGHAETLDIFHHIYMLTLDGALFKAPLDNPKNILDIGCGTGLWAIDIADLFPEANTVGTDIAPTQPTWIPPNLRFELEDCTQEWTFEPDSFDYVHLRYLAGCIVDWDALFREAFRATKPGGYCESAESSPRARCDDGSMTESTATYRGQAIFLEASVLTGRSFTMAEGGQLKAAMERAGFVDCKEFNYIIPSSGWPADPKLREIGNFLHLSVERDHASYVLYLATLCGWTKDEVDVFSALTVREGREMKVHAYYLMTRVYGRKPDEQ